MARFYEPIDDDLDDYDPLDEIEEREPKSMRGEVSLAGNITDFLVDLNNRESQTSDAPSQAISDINMSAPVAEIVELDDDYDRRVTDMLKEDIQAPIAVDMGEARDMRELHEMRIRSQFKPLSTRAPMLGGRKV